MLKTDAKPIFGIGLPKTGTTTLRTALRLLGIMPGYPAHIDGRYEAYVGDKMCLPLNRFKKLDAEFPNAKFILTLRKGPDVWYDSVLRWDKKVGHYKSIIAQRISMYGSPTPDYDMYTTVYKERGMLVTEYFIDKYGLDVSKKLLIVSFDSGDGWPELCEFLNLPIPNIPFPHKNKNNAN